MMNLVIIYGVSSFLGFRLAQQLLKDSGLRIIGLYRTKNNYVSTLEKNKNIHELIQIDLATAESPFDLLNENIGWEMYESVTVIYSCGVWCCGNISNTKIENLRLVNKLGFQVPAEIAIHLLQLVKPKVKRIQFLAITGLSGEKGAVRYNGIYNASVTALCNLCRALGMEIAGSGSCIMAFSIGLFDKGQAYIEELCRSLVIKRPLPIENVLNPICTQVQSPNYAFNGTVQELSDGLFNYQNVSQNLLEAMGYE